MDIFHITLLIVSLLSTLLTTILLYKSFKLKSAHTLSLGLFFLITSIYCFQGFVIETGVLNYVKWFYAWPLPIYSLTHVLVFIYFKTALHNNFTWKLKYFVLLVPFLLSLTDVYLFFDKSYLDRIAIVNDAIVNPDLRFEQSYGLLSLKSHYFIKYLCSLIVMLSISVDYFLTKFNSQLNKISKEKSRWLSVFFSTLTFAYFGLFVFFGQLCFPVTSNLLNVELNLIKWLFCFIFILIAIIPFYFPNVLYNKFNSEVFPNSVSPISISSISNQKEKNILLDNVNHDSIKFGLNLESIKEGLQAVEMDKLYLDHHFDVNFLANHLKIPVHHLSYILNQHYGLTFIAYRNNLRMQHAAKLIENGFLAESTIEALAGECGFTSRSAFGKTFKSIIGETPSEYAAQFQLILSFND